MHRVTTRQLIFLETAYQVLVLNSKAYFQGSVYSLGCVNMLDVLYLLLTHCIFLTFFLLAFLRSASLSQGLEASGRHDVGSQSR